MPRFFYCRQKMDDFLSQNKARNRPFEIFYVNFLYNLKNFDALNFTTPHG